MPQLVVIFQLLFQRPYTHPHPSPASSRNFSSSSLSLSSLPSILSSFLSLFPCPSLPCSQVNILCEDLSAQLIKECSSSQMNLITLETIPYKALLSNRNMQKHIQNLCFWSAIFKQQKEQVEIVLVIIFAYLDTSKIYFPVGNQYIKSISMKYFPFFFHTKCLKSSLYLHLQHISTWTGHNLCAGKHMGPVATKLDNIVTPQWWLLS